jgi:indolepyruvate ferredoxin oxidoreductase
LGNAIGANMFLIGYALQKGLLPVSVAAVERAIELNGVSVEFNIAALTLGRQEALRPRDVTLDSDRPDAGDAPTQAEREQYLSEYLMAYQGRTLVRKFQTLVDKVRTAEKRLFPNADDLTRAAAESLFKLLAYKDEYEVARLYSDGEFRRTLDKTFAGHYKLRFHLAPPLLARRDPVTGRPRKMEFGTWLLPVFGLLRHLRFLRGTALDPFGRSADRRMERRLIEEYESLIDVLASGLNERNYAQAVELAGLPTQIRGFGIVKARSVEQFRQKQQELLGKFRERA